MKSCYYYVYCDRCDKLQLFGSLKEKDPFHDDVDNDGIKFFSCTCGNINIKIIVSGVVL